MKGSFRLFKVFDISINIHVTFFILLLVFMAAGPKALFLIISIFCFVTMHELAHSLVAKHFGVSVREITLMPIGGIASMTTMPEKPSHEFLISIAGPLFNIAVVALLYFPMLFLVGERILWSPLSTVSWPHTLAYIYWINLVLAGFNLIQAFPMDGGRILRSALAKRMGYQKATKIAVNFGHMFALLFGYFGIIRGNLLLIAVAIFIYMAASGEGLQVDFREVLKDFRVSDVLSKTFCTLEPEATLAKALELVFHSHQEHFPIVRDGQLIGFLTRKDLIAGLHSYGSTKRVEEVMRSDVPVVSDREPLVNAQRLMQERNEKALPVVRAGVVAGIVTLEDIGRVYSMMSQK